MASHGGFGGLAHGHSKLEQKGARDRFNEAPEIERERERETE